MDQIRETNINLVNVVMKLNAMVSVLEEKGIVTGTEFKKALARQVDAVKKQIELEMKLKEENNIEHIEKINDVEIVGLHAFNENPSDSADFDCFIEVEAKEEESSPEETVELN